MNLNTWRKISGAEKRKKFEINTRTYLLNFLNIKINLKFPPSENWREDDMEKNTYLFSQSVEKTIF